MTYQNVPGWQIAAAADMARRGANKDAQQRYVDNVWRTANASAAYFNKTGVITEIGQQAIIERDAMRARGVRPSWQQASNAGATILGCIGAIVLLVVWVGLGWALSAATGSGWFLVLLGLFGPLGTLAVWASLDPKRFPDPARRS